MEKRFSNLYEWCLYNNQQLLNEWNYEKNTLSPKDIAPFSNKKVWWKCEKGHEWQASVNNRAKGRNCPLCSNKLILQGYNDLATHHPNLVCEWDFEKNGDITPYNISSGSSKKVWWKCKVGHEWQAQINSRTKGGNCPICAIDKRAEKRSQATKGENDLITFFPEIANEWNFGKNIIDIHTVTKSSNKLVWWKCENSHEYQATVNARTGRGNGCPYCSGHRVLTGFNDLETLRPNLMKEWNYNKNSDITPSQITIGSNKKVWWVCEKGHEWLSSISNRAKSNGTKCPKCRQQYHTSFPEKTIAYYLKRIFPDLIENYYGEEMQGKELDIFIPSQKLAIEYDGGYAHKNIKRDVEKDKICNLNNIKIIHIREFDCPEITDSYGVYFYMTKEKWRSLDDAINFVFDFLCIKPDFLIDNQADKSDIYEFMDVQEKENSLLKRTPELAREWHPTKNGFLKPEHLTSNSNVKVWWKCEKGHEWQAQLSSRMKGNGCPVCANKIIVPGFNDLETTHPHLIEEWNFERNGELTPKKLTKGSEKVVWWNGKCGHEYQASIYQRTSGHNCPICAGIQLLTGFNDLQTKSPEIAKDWNYEKNGNLTPDKVFASARKTVWWICEKGHEYQAAIYHRTGIKPTACPICANRKLLKGYNDFETLYPQIAKEWHPTLNENLKPDEVICRAGKNAWWKCSKCGHEYQKKVVQKILYPKCPKCQK